MIKLNGNMKPVIDYYSPESLTKTQTNYFSQTPGRFNEGT